MKSILLLTAVLAGLSLSSAALEITVDGAAQRQVMHGFGTCMKGWGDPEKDPVSKWQLETKAHELYVKDMGFTMVRIPIERWVLEGPNPYNGPVTVTDEMKKDPAKITWEAFNWEAAGGRVRQIGRTCEWAKALLKVSPDLKVFGSVWSPPHWMKEGDAKRKFEWSKFGSSSCGGFLSPKYYSHYAHYLAAWSQALEKKYQVPLYAVSIQNELHFFEPYDSCIYLPNEFAAVVKEVGRVFKAQGVKTRIMGPEDMTKFPDRLMSFVNPVLKDKDADAALEIVCSHGYSDGIESHQAKDDCMKLWDMIKDTGKEYWMTETGGGLGYWKDSETVSNRKNNKGQKVMAPGAFNGLATMLHNSIVYGHAGVWTTWQFLSAEEDCQHALVHCTMDELKPTKKYYVQKQYAKFIPAGARRVEATPDGQEKVLVSAFVHPVKKSVTLVLQNHAEAEVAVSLSLKDTPAVSKLERHLTTEQKDCEASGEVPVSGGKATLTLPAQSVVTLYGLAE
ncbi:MAG: hypothetical protein M5U26_14030 [Planctomycetota bacterium]|nr:hypothetical protein [Planctomycetota bacterium]